MRSKVVDFMGKVEYKTYPKAVWNSMTKEQQMQAHKLHKQQGINLAAKKTSIDVRITAIQAKLGITSQPKESNNNKKMWEISKEPAWGETEGILRWLSRHSAQSTRNLAGYLGDQEETPTWVGTYNSATCASVWTVHLSAKTVLQQSTLK